ncbi:MAG: hypothetical protein ACQXXJ_06745, partial [Candidatus Bathyarchaeia archaeon]
MLFLSHHIVGLIAELLAGFLVLKWIFRRFDVTLCKGKNLMRTTISTWLVSILLGIFLFLWHLIG